MEEHKDNINHANLQNGKVKATDHSSGAKYYKATHNHDLVLSGNDNVGMLHFYLEKRLIEEYPIVNEMVNVEPIDNSMFVMKISDYGHKVGIQRSKGNGAYFAIRNKEIYEKFRSMGLIRAEYDAAALCAGTIIFHKVQEEG